MSEINSTILLACMVASILNLCGMVAFIAGLSGFRHQQATRFESPIADTRRYRHQAGTWIRSKLTAAYDRRLWVSIEFMIIFPLLLFPMAAIWMLTAQTQGQSISTFAMVANAIVLLSVLLICLKRVIKSEREVQRLRLGLESELAVANELDKLSSEGFEIFHDVPFNRYNIDHVVVGDNGVHVIETKGHSRPVRKTGSHPTTLSYRDGIIIKPTTKGNFRDKQSVKQASGNARSLYELILKETRIKTFVQPAVVFPGWNIEVEGNYQVLVSNGTEIANRIRTRNKKKLNKDQRRDIEALLDKKCRQLSGKTLILLPEHQDAPSKPSAFTQWVRRKEYRSMFPRMLCDRKRQINETRHTGEASSACQADSKP